MWDVGCRMSDVGSRFAAASVGEVAPRCRAGEGVAGVGDDGGDVVVSGKIEIRALVVVAMFLVTMLFVLPLPRSTP
jgi:hypothetical protein